MYYLSIACIAKNEDLYLEEWVNFHRAAGAEHFFIYDNGSTVPIKQLLSKYINANIVDVIDFPGKIMQMPAYSHCLKNYGHLSKWIAFVDCDEFIVPKSNDDIKEVLKDYENYGGLVVNWLFFGSGGHITRPDGLVTENFIMSSHKDWCLNNHIKSIVQPERTQSIGDPHFFKYKPPYFAVSEAKINIPGSIVFKCKDCCTPGAPETHLSGNINANKIQVHHYYTKSEEEFMVRYYGGSCYATSPTRSNMEGFRGLSRVCNIENKEAHRFIDKTKSLYIK